MNQNEPEKKKKGKVGTALVLAGALSLFSSFFMIFALQIPGGNMHNALQIGGAIILLIGGILNKRGI